jgi:hypothetical protein
MTTFVSILLIETCWEVRGCRCSRHARMRGLRGLPAASANARNRFGKQGPCRREDSPVKCPAFPSWQASPFFVKFVPPQTLSGWSGLRPGQRALVKFVPPQTLSGWSGLRPGQRALVKFVARDTRKGAETFAKHGHGVMPCRGLQARSLWQDGHLKGVFATGICPTAICRRGWCARGL